MLVALKFRCLLGHIWQWPITCCSYRSSYTSAQFIPPIKRLVGTSFHHVDQINVIICIFWLWILLTPTKIVPPYLIFLIVFWKIHWMIVWIDFHVSSIVKCHWILVWINFHVSYFSKIHWMLVWVNFYVSYL